MCYNPAPKTSYNPLIPGAMCAAGLRLSSCMRYPPSTLAHLLLTSDKAEELLWQGRFPEALDYLEPRAREGYYQHVRLCCLIYGMSGSIEEARYYCDRAHKDAGRIVAPEVPDILAMMALTEWRAGNIWRENRYAGRPSPGANNPAGWLTW